MDPRPPGPTLDVAGGSCRPLFLALIFSRVGAALVGLLETPLGGRGVLADLLAANVLALVLWTRGAAGALLYLMSVAPYTTGLGPRLTGPIDVDVDVVSMLRLTDVVGVLSMVRVTGPRVGAGQV